jgi:hypothetical protein
VHDAVRDQSANASGVLTHHNDLQVKDLFLGGDALAARMAAPVTGRLAGTFFAADGVTPVSSVQAEAFDPASGATLESLAVSTNGNYASGALTAGTIGLRALRDGRVLGETTTRLAQDQALTVNLALPLAVLRGTATFADGLAVAEPNAFATQLIGQSTLSLTASEQGALGAFTIPGLEAGSYELTVQDPLSGLTARVTGTVQDVAAPITQVVRLPADGRLRGSVRSAAGEAVADAEVALLSAVSGFTRSTATIAGGTFAFDRVAVGTAAVQACLPGGLCASAVATIRPGDNTVALLLPSTGSVTGTLLDTANAPVAYAIVTIESLDGPGLLPTAKQTLATNERGQFRFDAVPFGRIRITASGGAATGSLTHTLEAATLDVTVRLGEDR